MYKHRYIHRDWYHHIDRNLLPGQAGGSHSLSTTKKKYSSSFSKTAHHPAHSIRNSISTLEFYIYLTKKQKQKQKGLLLVTIHTSFLNNFTQGAQIPGFQARSSTAEAHLSRCPLKKHQSPVLQLCFDLIRGIHLTLRRARCISQANEERGKQGKVVLYARFWLEMRREL